MSVNSSGNCDCGDTSFWKRSGFCSKHQGLEQDSQTDTVFKAIFHTIRKLEGDNTDTLSVILDFVKLFLPFCDGFRRLISISLTEKVNLEKFMNHLFECNSEFNQQIESLINDELFKTKFAQVNYKLMITRVIPMSIDSFRNEESDSYKNILPWDKLWFHSYSVPLLQLSIKKFNFDWFDFTFKVLNYMKEILTFREFYFELSDIPIFFYYLDKITSLTASQSNDQIQNLFDKLVTEILVKGTSKGITQDVNDAIVTTSFNEGLSDDEFQYIYSFQSIFLFF